MTNKTKQTAVLFTSLLVITYLVFSFIMWDFNAHNWNKTIRVAYILHCLVGSVISWAFLYINKL